jgi:hypothetical protein
MRIDHRSSQSSRIHGEIAALRHAMLIMLKNLRMARALQLQDSRSGTKSGGRRALKGMGQEKHIGEDIMKSNNTTKLMRRAGFATGAALEPVQIASDLIAFYPQAIHRPQPYVILLDPASGILKRLVLQATR